MKRRFSPKGDLVVSAKVTRGDALVYFTYSNYVPGAADTWHEQGYGSEYDLTFVRAEFSDVEPADGPLTEAEIAELTEWLESDPADVHQMVDQDVAEEYAADEDDYRDRRPEQYDD